MFTKSMDISAHIVKGTIPHAGKETSDRFVVVEKLSRLLIMHAQLPRLLLTLIVHRSQDPYALAADDNGRVDYNTTRVCSPKL